MIKELSNSIKAILYDRAISPVSGVFALVWVGFNWKPLAIFLWGADDIKARIAYIEVNYVDIWRNLYFPAITAATFLLIYPFISLAAYALWERVASWKVALKQKFESTVALPLAKSIALWQELRDKDRHFREAVEAKDLQIETLRTNNENILNELNKLKESLAKGGSLEAEIARRTEEAANAEAKLKREIDRRLREERELRNRAKELEEKLKELELRKEASASSLTDEALRLLTAVANEEEKGLPMTTLHAVKAAGLSRVEGNHYIDQLVGRNFMARQRDKDGDEMLFLSPPGREYLVNLRRKSPRPKR